VAAGPVWGATVPALPAVDFIGLDINKLALARMAALAADLTVGTGNAAVELIGLGIITIIIMRTFIQTRWAGTLAI
jgi:hypothetical protein